MSRLHSSICLLFVCFVLLLVILNLCLCHFSLRNSTNKEPVMANFVCHLDWVTVCPSSRSDIALDVSVMMVWKWINI